MRIAIVGTGISGMVASYLLAREHELTVFEAADYIGGHTNTITVDDDGTPLDVDTGFIVFNTWTYPNFCKLMKQLDVASQLSNMSFSVVDERTGLEYSGDNLSTLFAQRRRLWDPRHWGMLAEIVRFYRVSRALLRGDHSDLTLGEFLQRKRFGQVFIDQHLVPMGAAIWSAKPDQMLAFPAQMFVRFCHNHGMLNVLRRPRWRTISGGSKQYIPVLTRPYRDRIRLSTPIVAVERSKAAIAVTAADGSTETFDQVVFATHSDQVRRILQQPSDAERDVFSVMDYQRNLAQLHTDDRILPSTRRARASWNYRIPADPQATVMLTYDMNLLQSLPSEKTYCVSLNAAHVVDPQRVLREIEYDHPIYTVPSVKAQQRWREVSGADRIHYCGAYWGFGFHEDGVNSGLRVAADFGLTL